VFESSRTSGRPQGPAPGPLALVDPATGRLALVDSEDWDRRYASKDLVWGSAPNRWVEAGCADLPAGRALDLACGEGRNARWLAGRGWQVTAVDFSQVALDRGARLAEQDPGDRAARIEWVRADATTYAPTPAGYDLVVMAYLQLQAAARALTVRAAAAAVAPGGRLLVVAHDSTNLTQGVGGPQDPAVLYTAADLVADLDGTGLDVRTAQVVRRPVATDDGEREAVDALLVATRG